MPGNEIKFYGTFDPVYDKSLREILSGQMEYCYYPVRESELKARIDYASLKDGQSTHIGGAKVTPVLMNHPVLNFGYLIGADGKRSFSPAIMNRCKIFTLQTTQSSMSTKN